MLHAAAREGLLCPAYCLMPDHIHLIWLGLRRDTDQRNGMSFLRTHLELLLLPHQFQPQAYDHVLREEERKRGAFAKICFYVLANPVRAQLIKETQPWPYGGAVVPGYPKLHPLEWDFWPLFWKQFQKFRQPDADERNLPPRSSRKVGASCPGLPLKRMVGDDMRSPFQETCSQNDVRSPSLVTSPPTGNRQATA